MSDAYIIISLAILSGAFIQGCLGFGFGMISVPPLLMYLSLDEVIPMQIPLSMILTIPLGWQVRHHFQYKLVIPLLLGALIGLPIGIWVLNHFSGSVLRLAVGGVLVGLPTLMLMGWSRPLPNRLYTLIPIGMMSGVLQGSVSISAPPIILFLTNQGMHKDQFRANVLLFFTGLGFIALTGITLNGMYTPTVMSMIAKLLIIVPIGGYAGAKLATKIPQKLFRTLTLLVSAFMGGALLLRSAIVLLGQ